MTKMRLRQCLRNAALLNIAIGLGIAFASATSASAKTSRKVSHSYEKVWPAAVRFIRIDEGHKVLEKDMDNGYVLFEIAEEGKVFRGSIEVIRRKDSRDRDAVELVLTIKDRPRYMEHGILDRMLVKIRKELGLPKDPEETEPPKEQEEDEKKDATAAPESDSDL